MLKKMNLIIIIGIIIAVFSCHSPIDESENTGNVNEEQDIAMAAITNNIKYLAPIFAHVVNQNNEILSLIKEETNKQFDGDYDVLFDAIKDKAISKNSMTFMELLNNANLTRNKNASSIENYVSSIPHFNLYLYIPQTMTRDNLNFSNVVVAANRYDVDDTILDYVYAYDQNGCETTLSAQEAPDFPVLVLGINERVDMNGKVIEHFRNKDKNTTTRYTTGGDFDGKTVHHEKLYAIRLTTDLEGWLAGNPEVYALYNFGGIGITQWYDEVNDKNKWYYRESRGTIFTLRNYLEYQRFVVSLKERDGGSIIKFTLSLRVNIKGVNVNLSVPFDIKNGDDSFGDTMVDFYHIRRQQYSLGRAYMKFTY